MEGRMASRLERAEREVEQKMGKPRHEAVNAGLSGMVTVGGVLWLFAALAGLDLNKLALPGAAVVALGSKPN
jgi:hypothetical protein